MHGLIRNHDLLQKIAGKKRDGNDRKTEEMTANRGHFFQILKNPRNGAKKTVKALAESDRYPTLPRRSIQSTPSAPGFVSRSIPAVSFFHELLATARSPSLPVQSAQKRRKNRRITTALSHLQLELQNRRVSWCSRECVP